MLNSGRNITSNMNKLRELERGVREIFTAQDLAVVWGYPDKRKLFELIKYYVQRGEIFAIARGLYAKRDYTEKELRANSRLLYCIANKLVPNSYVSLFTVLKAEGVIDQYYDGVYSIASRRVVRNVRGIKFEYRRVSPKILWSDWGIEDVEGNRVASLERAVLDTWYSEGSWELGRTHTLDMVKLKQGSAVYGGRVARRVKNAKY